MWIQISAGQGPAACCWVVAQVYKAFCIEAKAHDIAITVLSSVVGENKKTFRSILLSLEGQIEQGWLQSWVGSILWIGNSPYRPQHKRKNWFVAVSYVQEPQKNLLHDKDLKWECMRASGPGGQHVNTSNTAVRVTHIPTGIQAKAQEERSQKRNKSLALARLIEHLQKKESQEKADQQKELWTQHHSLTRGNAIRSYKGKKFVLMSK